ncbi:MAG: hypothetical protein ACRC1M_06105, partial [Methanobacteriaceae archaeon]
MFESEEQQRLKEYNKRKGESLGFDNKARIQIYNKIKNGIVTSTDQIDNLYMMLSEDRGGVPNSSNVNNNLDRVNSNFVDGINDQNDNKNILSKIKNSQQEYKNKTTPDDLTKGVFEDKKAKFLKQSDMANQLYKTYIGGLGRIEKINGKFLATHALQLDELYEQNQIIIEQNYIIIDLLTKI